MSRNRTEELDAMSEDGKQADLQKQSTEHGCVPWDFGERPWTLCRRRGK